MNGKPLGRRRSVDSIPALVIHPPASGTTPPRPPRSPKRPKLPDIREEGSSSAPRTGEGDPALQELASLREAVQAFARRLQAIPPPESSHGSRASSSPSSTLESLRRTRSMSSIGGLEELERRRQASGGTFGAGIQSGNERYREEKEKVGQAQLPRPAGDSSDPIGPTTPLLPPSNDHTPISPLALGGLPLPQTSRNSTPGSEGATAMQTNVPTLHVTRPSTSEGISETQPFASVVKMMERGQSPAGHRSGGTSPAPSSASGVATLRDGPTMEGRTQTPRRGMVGPRGIIGERPIRSVKTR